MRILRNIFAVIGLVAVIAGIYGFIQVRSIINGFDPQALAVYRAMTQRLIATGNPAEATVWKRRVKDGLSFEDVDAAVKSIAQEMNIRDVGALPLGEQVEAMQGKPWRKLKIYLYCNPLTAAKMIDFSTAYSAYLPCRVALLEDTKGKLWLYTLDMDMMIYGGKPLPPELKKEAEKVKEIILAVLDRGAKGEF